MRLTDVVNLAEKYFILGLSATGLITGIFCILYFILYRKIFHGTAKFPLKKLAAAAVILCYLIVVLGATMLDRSSVWTNGRAALTPFFSYREAWYSSSSREWRNIILNICMFVPFGLLLPFCHKYWQKATHTYMAGFIFTLLIELAQLVLKRGIFELDDIFNNLLGTMIGYGLYHLLHVLPFYPFSGNAMAHPHPLRNALLYQIPLLLATASFGTAYTVYQLQEFGNLREHYICKANLSAAKLQLQTELSDAPQTVPVYKIAVADQAATHALAQEFFAKLDTQIDESETELYDETAVYWSPGRIYNIWIDYAGCPMRYTDFSVYEDKRRETGKSGCSKNEIQAALQLFGIQIPDSADFKELGDGKYLWEANAAASDSLCQGTLSCTCDADGKIISFDNRILTYEKYRSCEILSEQDAYGQLQDGKFRADYQDDDLVSVTIDNVFLSYAADSKGFYQPVYTFSGMINEEPADIQIPALK